MSAARETTTAPDQTREQIQDKDEFIHRFKSLYNSETFSDIVLRVGDNRYYAHKFLLITASEVFETMLGESRWKEANQHEVTLTEMDECIEAFPDFLKYLYSGNVEMTTSNVQPLLVLADKYGVKVLRKTCIDYMSNHIVESPNTNRTLTWYLYSKMTNCLPLQEKCLHFILSNFAIIQKAPDWIELDVEEMVEFLSSSELVVECEYKLWTEVERWLFFQYGGDHLIENLKAVLPFFRFTMMSPKQLLSIENSDLYKEHKDAFGCSLMEAYRKHSLLVDCAENQTKSELYRNYFSQNYSVCHDFKLKQYAVVAKNESRICNIIDVPIQYKMRPSSAVSDSSEYLRFETTLYPRGYYQIHPLYGPYMSRQNDLFCLKVKRRTLDALPAKVDITILIYGQKNNVKYVAHNYSTSFTFENKNLLCEINEVISIDKLKVPNSLFLVGKDFESRIFLKIQEITNEVESS